MGKEQRKSSWIKRALFGRPRELTEKGVFSKLALAATLAWIGLGADGLSSSCYGPEECFKALGRHAHLAPFVALACILTIAVICASYSQIIEAFPGGGGGYLVASKLLSPSAGAVSGCALLVDYVLTIAISVASGADALFSLLPASALAWKTSFSLVVVCLLTLVNLRGVKESVMIWAPVFFVFLVTHGAAIGLALFSGAGELGKTASQASSEIGSSFAELGVLGTLALLVRAYGVGAGTYTGIEAVSNGLPILKEPRVKTGKRAMLYMGVSLAVMAGGLLLAYLLLRVEPKDGMTLNAVLFDRLTASWSPFSKSLFIWISMSSAAALLFVAAQTGFLDGPRVLANMAADRWFPTRFSLLSDRLVAQNGILLMGAASFIVLLAAHGSVSLLVVLYSINVFITFTLSQTGMVFLWWSRRRRGGPWFRKLSMNGIGALTTGFILLTLCFAKFWEGGWMTILATGSLVAVAFLTKRHYAKVRERLSRLDSLVEAVEKSVVEPVDTTGKRGVAALFVNGYNGLGLHTLLGVRKTFPNSFEKFVFIQVGLVDAGNFKGEAELERLKTHLKDEGERYVEQMRKQGFDAASFAEIGNDLVQTASDLAAKVRKANPNVVFFGGQLVFEQETVVNRLFHNYAVFSIQRELYRKGMPLVIMPVRL